MTRKKKKSVFCCTAADDEGCHFLSINAAIKAAKEDFDHDDGQKEIWVRVATVKRKDDFEVIKD